MSTRATFKHATIYSAASVLGKLVGFIMLPFYAHDLGIEGYGVIGMVDATISLLSGVLAYGASGAVTRLYHEQPEGRKELAVSTGFWLVLCATALLVAIGMAISGPASALLFGDSSLALILCLALFSFMLDLSGQTATTILLIRHRSIAYSSIGLLRLISGLSLNILLIVILELGVYGYFLSAAITALVSYVVQQRICFKLCGQAYDREIAREIIKFQAPLVPSSLVSFASRQSERVILRFIESIEKVGILEMAYKFPSLIQLLIHAPFMQSWNTERIKIAQDGGDVARHKIGRTFTLSLYMLVTGGLLIALCIEDVLVILTPEGFWGAARIAKVECITAVIASATYHTNFGYLLRKDSRAWAVLSGSVSLVKVVLSFAFIMWLGILGAAYSALVSALILFVLATRGGQRRYTLHYRHRENALIVITALLLFALAEVSSSLLMSTAESIASWMLSGSALGALASGTGAMAAVLAKLPFAIDASFRVLVGSGMLLLWPVVRGRERQPPSA